MTDNWDWWSFLWGAAVGIWVVGGFRDLFYYRRTGKVRP